MKHNCLTNKPAMIYPVLMLSQVLLGHTPFNYPDISIPDSLCRNPFRTTLASHISLIQLLFWKNFLLLSADFVFFYVQVFFNMKKSAVHQQSKKEAAKYRLTSYTKDVCFAAPFNNAF